MLGAGTARACRSRRSRGCAVGVHARNLRVRTAGERLGGGDWGWEAVGEPHSERCGRGSEGCAHRRRVVADEDRAAYLELCARAPGCAARQGSGGARGVRRREAARAAWRARGGTARARRQVGSPAAAESHRGRLWSTESIRAPGSSIVSWSGRAGRVRGCHREPSWAQWGLRAPTSHRRPAAAGDARERRRVGEAGKSARTPLASTLRWT